MSDTPEPIRASLFPKTSVFDQECAQRERDAAQLEIPGLERDLSPRPEGSLLRQVQRNAAEQDRIPDLIREARFALEDSKPGEALGYIEEAEEILRRHDAS